MPCKFFSSGFVAGILGALLASSAALADPGADSGVTRDSIRFGQAAALQGPASALGLDMRAGVLAAFAEVNRAGGVKGRRLELISMDDGYDPIKSVQATKTLIDNEKVFALVGPVGTPTVNAALPIATEAGVPVVGPLTGAEFLRTPFKPLVINVRASYYQETEMMVDHLVKDLGARRIAILHQDDAFGRAGLEGVQRALSARGMQLAAEGSFERNTTAIKSGLLSIRKGNPDAVILVGPYRPCAEFIKLSKQMKMAPTFVTISFVGANALAQELGPEGAGVYVTQVAPFPGDVSNPLVARYQAALKEASPDARPGFVSLEGYMAGRVVIAGLERTPGEPSRRAFAQAILSAPIDLQGVTLTYGPDDNHGGQEVFLTMIEADGSIKPVKAMTSVVGH